MNETIITAAFSAFFALGTIFTVVFITMMCMDEFRKEGR